MPSTKLKFKKGDQVRIIACTSKSFNYKNLIGSIQTIDHDITEDRYKSCTCILSNNKHCKNFLAVDLELITKTPKYVIY